ncbi:MAG: hypothetical protein K2W96_10575 [Gemmataceae bacterium]|nr:hypothetical protein [Gemmataceae bacterium]
MGWFDWLGKKKPEEARPPSPEACYDTAYFVLPHLAFNDLEALADHVRRSPEAASRAVYAMGCQRRGGTVATGASKSLVWHTGDLDAGREYFLLAFPPPSPGQGDLDPTAMLSGMGGVLVPYFSAIIRGKGTDERHCFVLGQSPMGGRTTFRCVTRDGANCNLGSGPPVEKEAFLDRIRSYLAERGSS